MHNEKYGSHSERKACTDILLLPQIPHWPQVMNTMFRFLANPHRHMFHFRVWADVVHNDRDIEFIQFKRWLENLYRDDTLQLDYKSCEMMADDLYIQIASRYPNRAVWIEVSEDGENGALIKYEITKPYNNIVI
jgi:hypothetical protein